MIGRTKPGWALWGGAFATFGLFARTFHAGADHLAFQMARVQGAQVAAQTVAASYGAFHVVSSLTGAILFGWILLAIGAYRSGTLGLIRSLALSVMSALMIGVLKGSSITSVIAATGLCIAFVPLGVAILRAPPAPPLRTLLGCTVTVTGVVVGLFVLGRLG